MTGIGTDDGLGREIEALIAKVEKGLNRLKGAAYGVDVRKKHNADQPVIDTVVSHSDAMHELLFVRKDLRDLLLRARSPQVQQPEK